MIRHYRAGLRYAQLVADLLVVATSFLLAWYLRFEVDLIPRWAPIPDFRAYLLLLGLILAVWAVLLQVEGAGRQRRYRALGEEIGGLIQVHAIGILLVFAIIFFTRFYSFSRVMILLFWSVSTVALVAERIAARRVLRALAGRGFGLRQILLVGTGEQARQVLRRFQLRPELGFRFAGLLARESGRLGEKVRRVPVIGTYADVARIAAEADADLVILALPTKDQDAFDGVIRQLEDAMVDVWVVPDFVEHVRLRGGVAELEGLPLISLQASPMGGWNAIVKRATDLFLAVVGIGLLSPLMLLAALAVRLTSRGPVLFRQERMGLDGRSFQILKFRSMVREAEPDGARFASERDPRVTPVGRLLRKTSLDELPQLFNVLKGQMSLVGPRPERPVFIEEFRHHFPRYMLRHRVKAGMTGFAQVRGLRGNTSLEKRLEADLFYIENWSLWLDLKILWLTIPTVLRGKGAL